MQHGSMLNRDISTRDNRTAKVRNDKHYSLLGGWGMTLHIISISSEWNLKYLILAKFLLEYNLGLHIISLYNY